MSATLQFLRRAVALILIAALLPLSGCGYLIFNERVGQPDGEIDWGIFALDAVGLLFGVIPGVVAFAVDFSTGCIYLPSAPVYGQQGPLPGNTAIVAGATPLPGWELAALVAPFAAEAEVDAAVRRALAARPDLRTVPAGAAIEWQRELPSG